MTKCNISRKDINVNCDYNQGRCPNRTPLIDKPYPTWLLLVLAPFIIGAWVITHPKQVWEQAKKEWDLK